MAKPKKHCTNAACSLRDTQVETDAEDCVACGRPLKAALGDLAERLFGKHNDNPFSDLFGK